MSQDNENQADTTEPSQQKPGSLDEQDLLSDRIGASGYGDSSPIEGDAHCGTARDASAVPNRSKRHTGDIDDAISREPKARRLTRRVSFTRAAQCPCCETPPS